MHGREFERSDIDAAAFDAAFRAEAQAKGHDVPGRDVLALLAGDIRPEMLAVLDGVEKPRLSLGLYHQ